MAEDLPTWFMEALPDWQAYFGVVLAPAWNPQVAPPGENALAPPGGNGLAQAAPQGDAASLDTPPIREVEFETINWQPSSPWRDVLDALGEEEGEDRQEENEFCLEGLFSPWVDEDQEALEDARGCELLDACLLPLSPQSQDELLELGIMPELDGLDWEAESGLEPCATGGPSTSKTPIQSDAATTITGKNFFIIQ